MGALFFGSSKEPLYGFFHPARGNRLRDTAVLLCPSLPQEYMRMHWAFRRLADLISRQGFPVLRFDYYGTGDSAGDTGAGSLEAWRRDIVTAAHELKDLATTAKISAVAFRLGAPLAATAPVHFSSLVLWDPVVHGGKYVAELEAGQRRVLEQDPASDRVTQEELLGYPFPAALRSDLRRIDMVAAEPPRAQRANVLVSAPSPEAEGLARAWRARDVATSVAVVPDDTAGLGQFQTASVANEMLQAIVSQFA